MNINIICEKIYQPPVRLYWIPVPFVEKFDESASFVALVLLMIWFAA